MIYYYQLENKNENGNITKNPDDTMMMFKVTISKVLVIMDYINHITNSSIDNVSEETTTGETQLSKIDSSRTMRHVH